MLLMKSAEWSGQEIEEPIEKIEIHIVIVKKINDCMIIEMYQVKKSRPSASWTEY